jgi:N-acetylglucosamine-6-phosphate deacetylase
MVLAETALTHSAGAIALVGGRVLTPDGVREGLAVVIDGADIAWVGPADDLASGVARRDLAGGLLLPGFIDVQVNGGAGRLFNDDPSVATIRAIGAAHRRFGATGFLPTLISDDLEVVARAIGAVRQGLAEGVPGLLGIHIEGPFLNASRKGIHDARKFRVIDERAFTLLSSLAEGITLVTLAPEKTTPAMIARLTAAGVIVSAGHTNADYSTIKAALAAGLTGFTHLFNAMSPLTSRSPGTVGAALEDPASWCGLIVDGRHVDPVVLKLALRCKSPDRFLLVTDAMPSVGMIDKAFTLQGQPIRVVNGVCVRADGALAGSDLDMAGAVRNAMDLLGLDLPRAVAMATRNPAAFLGLERRLGAIAPGLAASLVLADDRLNVLETWIDGMAQAPAR